MLLEAYASMKEIESRTGVSDTNLGDVRLVSITGWPAHDLFLLLRNDITSQLQQEKNDGIGTFSRKQINRLIFYNRKERNISNSPLSIVVILPAWQKTRQLFLFCRV